MAGNFQVGGWTASSLVPQGVTRGNLVNLPDTTTNTTASTTIPNVSGAGNNILSQILGQSSQTQSAAPIQQQDPLPSDYATANLQNTKAQSISDFGTLAGAAGSGGSAVSSLLTLGQRMADLGNIRYTPGLGASYANPLGINVGMPTQYEQETINQANILNAALFGTGVKNQFSAPAQIAQAAAGSNVIYPQQQKPQKQNSGWVSSGNVNWM